MRAYVMGVIVVASVGCKKEPRYDGPMPVQFGDCASTKVVFISGPRPAPLTPQAPSKLATVDSPNTDDPPPPEEADLDEGSQSGEDRALARQQAIEAARAAGILGASDLHQGGAFASLTGTDDVAQGDPADVYGQMIKQEAGGTDGGFGFGRGRLGHGDDGWGTIGTGRYGTHGHGSGAGYGGDPGMAIGQPNVQGDLDKAIIRRYIKREIPKITYCYEKQLLATPGIGGTLQVEFFIKPDGKVATATGSGVHPEVATCVAGVIKAIEFPKPKGTGGVQVNYPFTFRSADAPNAGSGSAVANAAPGAGSGAGSAAPPPVPPSPLYRDKPSTADLSTYVPGAANPLHDEEKALTDCFRKAQKHYGVVAVELTYDASGKVTDVVPHGLDDARARKCVIAVAKKTKGSAGMTGQRCSISFGQMPIADLPTLAITADAITLDAKPIVTLKAVDADDHLFKIEPLFAAIQARVAAVTAPNAPVVSLHGPLVLAPQPTTPMKYVNRVVANVLMAQDDFVFRQGNELLTGLPNPLALPLVPVPVGTGARWNRVKGGSPVATNAIDEEAVILSVLVTKDRIWIGVSRVQEFQEIAAGANQADQLLAKLKEQKATAFFADRVDIEVGGEDDATYEQVVKAIGIAKQAGFIDWRFSDPRGLAARPTL